MVRYISNVGSEGAIILPAKIRAQLGIEPGDDVSFEITESGVLMRRSLSPAEDLYGTPPSYTWKELRALVRDEIALNAAREGLYPDDDPSE